MVSSLVDLGILEALQTGSGFEPSVWQDFWFFLVDKLKWAEF